MEMRANMPLILRRIAVLEHHTVKAVTDIFPVKRLAAFSKFFTTWLFFSVFVLHRIQYIILVRNYSIPYQLLIFSG